MLDHPYTRREFIKKQALAGAGAALTLGVAPSALAMEERQGDRPGLIQQEPIIDVHQHTDYHDRTNPELLAHQRTMGATTTILLPAWRPDEDLEGLEWLQSGLDRWATTGNEACFEFARKYPDEFISAANGIPVLPESVRELARYLDQGAPLIGEMKYGLACDSPAMQQIYEIAQSYSVPVLMHWQYKRYNFGFERFHTMLEKYPKVNFIGHAQTWWANIDKDYDDPTDLSPESKVTRGGLTDRLLTEYPNMYGELSAGSGLNAMSRDEDHTRGFLERHQDKLLYGSDDGGTSGKLPECRGARSIAIIRRLSATKEIERKILYGNAKRLLRL